MPALLGIHVFGSTLGESIVVELPNGKWGLVDCYVPSLERWEEAPVNKFLIARGISELEFVCLTHPHDDHFKGMSRWADKTSRFWLYGGVSNKELYQNIFASFVAEKELYPGHAENLKESLLELTTTIKLGAKTQGFKRLALGLPLLQLELEEKIFLEIIALGSTPKETQAYQDYLSTCFKSEGAAIVLSEKIKQINHNQISSGLLLKYGKSQIILGGDMERGSWAEVEAERDDLKSDLIKVSHHASETGFTDTLWPSFSPDKQAKAVFTCYAKSHLPRKEGLLHIAQHSKTLHTTSVSSCNESLDSESGKKQAKGDKESKLDILYDNFEIKAVLSASLDCVEIDDPSCDGRWSYYFDSNGITSEESENAAGLVTVSSLEATDIKVSKAL